MPGRAQPKSAKPPKRTAEGPSPQAACSISPAALGGAKGFRSSALTLLQLRLDRLQSVDLVRLLDRGDLANHPVESGLVQLPLRIGLLGLRL